ncbi:unnamed protein product [Peronospora effusa]|nr:unnamed protein product [Peronospora effusa]
MRYAERRQLEKDRISSYTDDAFECESPHAILASSRGLRPDQRSNLQVEAGSSSYMTVDNLRAHCVSDGDEHEAVTYGELAQPRPEIILRWKRFVVLVVLVATVMTVVSAWLREGFVVDKGVSVSKAENKVDAVNSYIGLMMGFIESFVGLGVEEIFPVFVVYLHNLRWYTGDDPATKKQSKFKKFALTIFIPTVMMAVGSSLSAVQANQKDDNAARNIATTASTTTTRFLVEEATELNGNGLGDTILKTALARKVEPMLPLKMSTCSSKKADSFSAEALLAAAPKAVFGFPLKEWGAEFGNGWSRGGSSKHYEVSQTGARDAGGAIKLSDVMPLAAAHELWMHGKPILLKSMRAARSSQKSLTPSSLDELLDSILKSLFEMELPLAHAAALDASFDTLELSSNMDLDVMTLKVPLRSPRNASVVCGESCCGLLQQRLNIGQQLPRKQIGMTQMNGNCSHSVDCDRISNAAFLYGFTTVTTAESATVVLTRSLVLSFARLSWQYDRAAYACEAGADREEGCQVLRHQLGDSDRHLVLPKQWLPAQFQNGSPAASISLVQLLEPKIRQTSGQALSLATLEHLESWPQDSTDTCSVAVDTFLQYVNSNHFYMGDDIAETMAASALLFIFQNARVLDSAPGMKIMVQRRLVDTTTRRVKVFLTNTKVGNRCTWTGCGLLLLLTALVFLLPNERARLSPPRGGNARAERFVAVQTEQVYPNLIYKKRFRIGKTGEEIKFGEFAVKSVGLHHEMEEDEQIYI